MSKKDTVKFEITKGPFTQETTNRYYGNGVYDLDPAVAMAFFRKGVGSFRDESLNKRAGKELNVELMPTEDREDIPEIDEDGEDMLDLGESGDSDGESEDEKEEGIPRLPKLFMDKRTRGVLENAGYNTIDKIRALSKNDLIGIKGISEAGAVSIGLELAEWDD